MLLLYETRRISWIQYDDKTISLGQNLKIKRNGEEQIKRVSEIKLYQAGPFYFRIDVISQGELIYSTVTRSYAVFFDKDIVKEQKSEFWMYLFNLVEIKRKKK